METHKTRAVTATAVTGLILSCAYLLLYLLVLFGQKLFVPLFGTPRSLTELAPIMPPLDIVFTLLTSAAVIAGGAFLAGKKDIDEAVPMLLSALGTGLMIFGDKIVDTVETAYFSRNGADTLALVSMVKSMQSFVFPLGLAGGVLTVVSASLYAYSLKYNNQTNDRKD